MSLRTLHDLPLAEAVELMLRYFDVFEACAADTGWRLIRYEDLVTNPARMAQEIAGELGLARSAIEIEAVLANSSRDRHTSVMRQVADGRLPNVRHRPNRYRVLTEDPQTLINDRHIQSGAIGRWRGETQSR